MKRPALNPLSFCLGVAAPLLLSVQGVAHPDLPLRIAPTVEVLGIHNPLRESVVISEGAPYVVPPGRVFVALSIGSYKSTSNPAILTVNGVDQLTSAPTAGAEFGSMKPAPPGFAFGEGTTIEVRGGDSSPGDNDARIRGYLLPN